MRRNLVTHVDKIEKKKRQKDSVVIARYADLYQRLFLGIPLSPMNTGLDRQELARFADYVRKVYQTPLSTCKYLECKTVAYRLEPSTIEDFHTNRAKQQREMKERYEQLSLERDALVTVRLFYQLGLPVPDQVLLLVKRANERPAVHEIVKLPGKAPKE